MFCARKIVLVKQGSRITMAWCMIALFGFLARAYSADPRIAFIIRTNVNKVDVHFYTDPNRTYELQAINSLPCGTKAANCGTKAGGSNNWTNLITFPPTPFPAHYFVREIATNKTRFYRLRVTP